MVINYFDFVELKGFREGYRKNSQDVDCGWGRIFC